MKAINGSFIIDRMFYYVADFNDRNSGEIMWKLFAKMKIRDLTEKEFNTLFKIAVKHDISYCHNYSHDTEENH